MKTGVRQTFYIIKRKTYTGTHDLYKSERYCAHQSIDFNVFFFHVKSTINSKLF